MTIEELLKKKAIDAGQSAISSILTEQPKQVSTDNVPPAPPDVEPEPESSGNPFAVAVQPTPLRPSRYEEPEPEEEYIPLSDAEINAKAESKAEMWAAVIALLSSFLNRWIAYQQLRKGDKQLIAQHEQKIKETGNVPAYAVGHPYHDAKERYDKFEQAQSDAEEEAYLTEGQKKLLIKAIAANLKSKNRRGALRQSGVGETLFDIMLIKAITPLMGLGMVAVNKMTDKTMNR